LSSREISSNRESAWSTARFEFGGQASG
jgi:hypothetical protein